MKCGDSSGWQSNLSFEDVPRTWGKGWRRYFFPGFWLVYLGQTVSGVDKHSHGTMAVVGYVLVAAFAATYLVALPMGWMHPIRTFWWLFALGVGLTVAESFFARDDALVFCIYLAVLAVAARARWTPLLIIGLVLATGLSPRFVPGWSGHIDWDGGLTVFLVAFAMFGFFMIVRSNIELSAARAEVARLAAENERGRIARDLHDLLGHSLTTITVKAALARRLAERGEATRSLTEITEVEKLSRRTLADVRAAVAGHNDVTLAGELATSREVLRAAAIETELPGSVDPVDADLSELFGWVVREAVTNVVRHSRAQHCVITLGPRWIEIADDGRGGSANGAGNGLTGLRERVGAAGGTLLCVGSVRGWRVRAEVPVAAPVPEESVPTHAAS